MASPISIAPSSFWDGNDGLWNSFIVQIGTPPQDFRVFPSTAGQATWVPMPEGCIASDPDDCPYLRGALPFQGSNSSGLQINASSTWDNINIYTLNDPAQAALGYGGNGLFGLESVVWGNGSESVALQEQVVAGIADKSFYLGAFGLGPRPSNFSEFGDPATSFISSLVEQEEIPSLSWAYTAGAAYRDRAPASLTLGGYDENRLEPSELEFVMDADNSQPLTVYLRSIQVLNSLQGSVNVMPTPTYYFIDSTVPLIWLPDDAIDACVDAFGLVHDDETDLFLVNDTIHDELVERNPILTFALSSGPSSSDLDAQNVELPYAAFDLEARDPFYDSATRYFPIRRAANDSQHTIGRVFLQEAYLIADFERSTFQVTQARFDSLDDQKIVAIETVKEADSASSSPSSSDGNSKDIGEGLSGGAIAGIVIGVIAALAMAALVAWWMLQRRRRIQRSVESEKHEGTAPEETGDAAAHGAVPEKGGEALHEMPSPPLEPGSWAFKKHFSHEMPSPPPELQGRGNTKHLSHELPAPSPELEGGENRKHFSHELHGQSATAELEGSDGRGTPRVHAE